MPECRHLSSHVQPLGDDLLWCSDCGAVTRLEGPGCYSFKSGDKLPENLDWQMPQWSKNKEEEFDWRCLRAEPSEQPTREATILRAFYQYAEGNEWGELSSCEAEHFYHLFRDGWLVAEQHIQPVVKTRL